MPAINPKQIEQNAWLDFIMQTDFVLNFAGEAVKISKMEQKNDLASIKREQLVRTLFNARNWLKIMKCV